MAREEEPGPSQCQSGEGKADRYLHQLVRLSIHKSLCRGSLFQSNGKPILCLTILSGILDKSQWQN